MRKKAEEREEYLLKINEQQMQKYEKIAESYYNSVSSCVEKLGGISNVIETIGSTIKDMGKEINYRLDKIEKGIGRDGNKNEPFR